VPAYADYTYYADTFLGETIPEAQFPRLALRASALIDQLTFGRAAADTDNTNAIKNAVCAVAEEIYTAEQNNGADGIQSESVGSHSVTYAENSTQRLTNDQRYADAAHLYLGSTGLMFAGFAAGEYGGTLDAN
jgi:hypothetical protein